MKGVSSRTSRSLSDGVSGGAGNMAGNRASDGALEGLDEIGTLPYMNALMCSVRVKCRGADPRPRRTVTTPARSTADRV